MFNVLKELLFGTTINTKIYVEFINHLDNTMIHEAEIEQHHLPEDFSLIGSVTFLGKEYLLVNADQVHANQYSFHKKLKLRINPIDVLNSRKIVNDPSAGSIKFGEKPVSRKDDGDDL